MRLLASRAAGDDSLSNREDFHGTAPKSLRRFILCPVFQCFRAAAAAACPAGQQQKQTHSRPCAEFSFARKASFQILPGSIRSFFFRQFSS